ncbi:MAG TPA: hypothetical protein VJB13_04640 [Candidatus Nanoarchaeia archaeon]|nr:hypothetical protein [Candidatus Nanoarchaeia archaeon]
MTKAMDVFMPLTDEQREQFLEDYMEHLYHRNGAVDLSNRRFSVRENFFQDLETNPVCRYGMPIVDRTVFERNETKNTPEPGLDEATLWALAVAKSNRAERDGVEYMLSHTDQNSLGPDNPLTYINIEEFYHTRVLKDALNILGLEMRLLPPPPMAGMIGRSVTQLPKYISNVIVFAAEIAGVAAFRMLRDKAYELFDDQPEPLKRIDELFQQILVDEVGHVHYVRSQLGPARLQVAKTILPMVARGFIHDMPEYNLLFGKNLMDTIVAADVDSAVAHYHDKFVPIYE